MGCAGAVPVLRRLPPDRAGPAAWIRCGLVVRTDLRGRALRTSAEYLESLVDGRVTWFEGRRVADPLDEPLLAQAARVVAAGYDQWYDPGTNARNPLMTAPADEADLRARVPQLLSADFALDLSYQALMALSTAGAALSGVPGPWVDRIKAYVESAQQADDRVAVCVTDAKGDRSLP